MFPELGDAKCPLLGLNNLTPPGGAALPPKKAFFQNFID